MDDSAAELIPMINESSVSLLQNAQVPLTPVETGHIPVDADVFPQDNSKTQKEGVGRTYKNYDGFSHGQVSEPRQGKRVGVMVTRERKTIDGQSYFFNKVVRVIERNIDKHGQYLVKPDIELEGWWTNLDLPSSKNIELYCDHALSEQYHSEFKTDLDLERLPSGKFATNSLVMAMGALAYNCLRLIGQNGLLGKISPVRHPAEMAASLVMGRAAGYDQCTAIVDYIRNTVRYTPGAGQQIISASELNELGSGVCRDLAHLAIACCRALSIPARMVVGYLEHLEPMDLHAWFEAYVGNRWYTFDPTQVGLQGGRVAIAFGRDAADVAIYSQFGDPVDLLSMQVNVERMAGSPF